MRHPVKTFKVGDKAWYYGNFGQADRKACTIVGVGEKDDQLVYDCDMADGDTRWGYADQFTPR